MIQCCLTSCILNQTTAEGTGLGYILRATPTSRRMTPSFQLKMRQEITRGFSAVTMPMPVTRVRSNLDLTRFRAELYTERMLLSLPQRQSADEKQTRSSTKVKLAVVLHFLFGRFAAHTFVFLSVYTQQHPRLCADFSKARDRELPSRPALHNVNADLDHARIHDNSPAHSRPRSA